MMYRFSWKRCIGFYPKSWKRGLWHGNIGCSQQTKTWYYFSCSTRGVLHLFWLSHIFPKGLGREPPTIRGLFTLKLSQLSESTVVVILCFVCVCVEGWTQCNLYPLSKADVDPKKTPASTKKNRIGHEFLAAEERRSGKFRFQNGEKNHLGIISFTKNGRGCSDSGEDGGRK